jgi:SAM-dependent methyltransferase
MVDEQSAKPAHPPYEGLPDWYEDVCWVCGTPGKFVRDRVSLSESFRCSKCQGALRYQGQARAVVRAFARHGARSIAALAREPEFRRLKIFESDGSGHFRRHFSRIDGHLPSTYAPDAKPRERRNGVNCEDLMRLSFASMSIDLVLTSDVFEHVRHPRVGFSEVFRVLRPGGMHIFTIPVRWPMRERTVPRVDVSGADESSCSRPCTTIARRTSSTTTSDTTCSRHSTRLVS